MTTDWNHSFLISTDFEQVDEPLFTAILNFESSWMSCDKSAIDFVCSIMRKVGTCQNIKLKKFLWLSLMLVSPSMQHFVVGSCSKGQHYARWWIKFVKDYMEKNITGEVDMTEFLALVTQAYATGSFLISETAPL